LDYQDEQDKHEVEQKSAQEKLDKAEIIEKERQEILENASSFKTDTIRDKTAWVLNHYPEAGDSDITVRLQCSEIPQKVH